MMTRLRTGLLALLAAAGLVTGLLSTAAPSSAATWSVVFLHEDLYAGPVVGYHFSVGINGTSPAGTVLRYQWLRGDIDNTPSSFEAIPGATDSTYTMTAEDHHHRLKVRVRAVEDGNVVEERSSGVTNFILWQMRTPVISGKPLVGQLLTASLGSWTSDWDVEPQWRRGRVGTSEMRDIAGETGLTYRTRPADVGKPVTLLVMAYHQFPAPNDVLAIDRRWGSVAKVGGVVPPVRWATRSILRGTSPAKGQLRLTAVSYAWSDLFKADQTQVYGNVRIYDGSRLLTRSYIDGGRRAITLRGLSRGTHRIRMVFLQNNTYAASSSTTSFTVR
ncbi:Ig-like domain repeat protein [Nocardioides aromaticivorans]|nr:Ig-like domain repeat protein [Nocardioides aromaticivorans]